MSESWLCYCFHDSQNQLKCHVELCIKLHIWSGIKQKKSCRLSQQLIHSNSWIKSTRSDITLVKGWTIAVILTTVFTGAPLAEQSQGGRHFYNNIPSHPHRWLFLYVNSSSHKKRNKTANTFSFMTMFYLNTEMSRSWHTCPCTITVRRSTWTWASQFLWFLLLVFMVEKVDSQLYMLIKKDVTFSTSGFKVGKSAWETKLQK